MTARTSLKDGIMSLLEIFCSTGAARLCLFYTHHPANAMDYVNNRVCQQDEEVDEDEEQIKLHGEMPPNGRCKYRSCNDIRFSGSFVSSFFILQAGKSKVNA